MTETTLRLITRVLSQEASEAEEKELQQWKDASEINRACYREFEEVWQNVSYEESLPDVENGIAYLRKRISFSASKSEDQNEKTPKKITSSFNLFFKIAATFLILCIAASGFYLNYYAKEKVLYKELVMPYGKKGSLHLTDGSSVKMNSGSKIYFPDKFGQDSRKVKVEGEAFFEVAKDPQRPFIIETGELEIKVLGTSFNLKSYENEPIIEIGVKTGSVSVTRKNKDDSGKADTFHLMPDELLSFNSSRNTFEKNKVDMDLVMSWTNETLVFDDKSFLEVAIMLERWYNIPILLENDRLHHCMVMGEYNNEKLLNILEALKFSMGIEYEILDHEVRITGKGCKTQNNSMMQQGS